MLELEKGSSSVTYSTRPCSILIASSDVAVGQDYEAHELSSRKPGYRKPDSTPPSPPSYPHYGPCPSPLPPFPHIAFPSKTKPT